MTRRATRVFVFDAHTTFFRAWVCPLDSRRLSRMKNAIWFPCVCVWYQRPDLDRAQLYTHSDDCHQKHHTDFVVLLNECAMCACFVPLWHFCPSVVHRRDVKINRIHLPADRPGKLWTIANGYGAVCFWIMLCTPKTDDIMRQHSTATRYRLQWTLTTDSICSELPLHTHTSRWFAYIQHSA